MAKKTYNVALIGYKFMGKAHSQAWREAPLFFDLADATPVLKVACGRHEEPLREFAERWGWEEIATDWREVVARDDIDIVDISAPTNLHYDIALAAAAAGESDFLREAVLPLGRAGGGTGRGGREVGRVELHQPQLSALSGGDLRAAHDRRREARHALPLAWLVPSGLDHGSELPAHLALAERSRRRRPALRSELAQCRPGALSGG